MIQIKGTSIVSGIAIGPITVLSKTENQVKRIKITNVDAEVKRYEKASEEAGRQLTALYEKALKEIGNSGAAIFEVHHMMLQDNDYADSIRNMIITQTVNAEYAVAAAGDDFSAHFSSMEDEYMQARAADIKDISNRLIRILSGDTASTDSIDAPSILMADDLTPSETLQLNKKKLLAFVTRQGSSNSHTAILARAMNIPALIHVDFSSQWNGKTAIVDGYTGTLIIDPTEEILTRMQKKKQADEDAHNLLSELKGKENITLDGHKIDVYANIGNASDVAGALANDAGGIGLFRSEFLYLGASDYPTEEEQFQAYRTVAEAMAGRRVIIRTLDIGADKQADYLGLDKEVNPAMGLRAIRICLTRPEIFKTQLRAILRASVYGNISIMFPMIISVEEVLQIKEILESVKEDLNRQNISYRDMEIGIMIETPASVMISDELAKEVDFFSIGTNDLTQYTLAIDRQNPHLDAFYDAHHPAVLRMIRQVIDNGHAGGCQVGICGELAADLSLTETFLKMGIDELSVSPAFILPLRKTIREISLS